MKKQEIIIDIKELKRNFKRVVKLFNEYNAIIISEDNILKYVLLDVNEYNRLINSINP